MCGPANTGGPAPALLLLAVAPGPVSSPGPRGQRGQRVRGEFHLEVDGGGGVPVLHQSVHLGGGGAAR